MSRRTPDAIKAVAALLAMVSASAVVATVATASADTCIDSGTAIQLPLMDCAAVLAQEGRWLTAITSGDVATVDSILGPTFRHVNADGEMLDRAREMAAMEPLDVAFTASDQIVDIFGHTAVIHGINTVTQAGDVVGRERFVDVFLLQNGVWKALTAQETVAVD